jgi:hypothetical protein
MKKPLVIAFLTFIIIVACTNRDGEIIDLINSVKKQNDDLKAQITALKKTTDSALVAVLKVNSMQSATERKIDLIQTDLKTILTQISSLTSQMTSTNADLVTLKAKIDALQAKCAELVAQIATIADPQKTKSSPKIGDEYGGGIVFYIDPISFKGLVVTKENVRDGSTEWGCYCQDIKNTKTDVGSGQNNTKEMLNQCISSQSIPNWSAKIVNELVRDGFDDWYLPSKDELNLIYQNLHLKGFGNFSKTIPYWSSTQASYGSCGPTGGGWSQNFGTGEQIQVYKSGYAGTGAVRAIRGF